MDNFYAKFAHDTQDEASQRYVNMSLNLTLSRLWFKMISDQLKSPKEFTEEYRNHLAEQIDQVIGTLETEEQCRADPLGRNNK